MSEELDKAVEKAVTQPLLEPDPDITDWISTGCTWLDMAISNRLPGGFPIGAVTEVSGPPSTSKSVLAMTASGACQRKGGIVFYTDTENTFEKKWSQMYGVDISNTDTFRLSSGADCPHTVEDFFDNHIDPIIKMKDDRPKLAIVDTLSALSDETEIKDDLDKSSYGARKANRISAAFRKYSPAVLAKANLSLVFINQVRDNIGGRGYVTSGGWAVPFYSSVRIRVTKKSKIEKTVQEVKIPIGIEVGFDVIKNKVGPPFRTGVYRILFDYGLDDIYSCLKFLHQFQKDDNVVFDGKDKAMRYMVADVEKNGLEYKLYAALVEKWREVYKPSERTPRKW